MRSETTSFDYSRLRVSKHVFQDWSNSSDRWSAGQKENSHEILVFATRCSQVTAGAFPNGIAVLNQP